MNNKKIGVLLLIISILLLVVFLVITQSLFQRIDQLGCYQTKECTKVETSLSITHFAFGIFGFLFALSFYLLFFTKAELAIVNKLQEHEDKTTAQEKFTILLKGLDEFEQEVMKAVQQQQGITQNTLALRTNMSKAKLSQVLSTLEKKNLIKREKDKKTFAVYLVDNFQDKQ